MARLIVSLPTILLCLLLSPAIAFAQATFGGYTTLSNGLDNVAEMQSVGLEAALFGPHLFLEDGAQAVTGHVFVGGYGENGILAGAAASYQIARRGPWGFGASAAFSDADVYNWTIGLNLQRPLWESKRTTLLVQGAVARQWLAEGAGSPTAVYFEYRGFPDNPRDLVLIDDFSLTHGFVHAIYQIRWGFLEPIVDVGWVGTYYSLDGRECGDGSCFEPGATRSRNGAVQKMTFGAGAALRLDRVAAFSGVKVNLAAAMFLVSLTVDF